MNKLNFVFFNFGDKLENYSLCNLAILSAKKFAPESRIIIYTDKPHYFKWVDFVEINILTPELLTEWKGKHNFLWRVKIKVIEDATQKYDGHVVYMDSDIFVKSNLTTLIEKLNQNYSFMHLNEGPLSLEKTPIKKKMFHILLGKTINNIKFDENMEMWNAGIVALPNQSKLELITKALNLNDSLCDLIKENWLVEQFSLSMALRESQKLNPSSDFFIHYWGNKSEWLNKIQIYFNNAFILSSNATELVESLNPDDWTKLPINRAKRPLNRRITNFMNKHFADKVLFTRN